MKKFELKKGWTKKKVMDMFKRHNNGTCAFQDNECQYITDDGNRCAVGAFIPDGHTVLTNQEIGDAETILTDYPELREYMPLDDVDGLNIMQQYHDETRLDTETIYRTFHKHKSTYEAMKTFLKERIES